MSLIKPESSIHSHLDSKSSRKHDGIHTVTTGKEHHKTEDGTPHEAPFGEIVLDAEEPAVSHPKSILGL